MGACAASEELPRAEPGADGGPPPTTCSSFRKACGPRRDDYEEDGEARPDLSDGPPGAKAALTASAFDGGRLTSPAAASEHSLRGSTDGRQAQKQGSGLPLDDSGGGAGAGEADVINVPSVAATQDMNAEKSGRASSNFGQLIARSFSSIMGRLSSRHDLSVEELEKPAPEEPAKKIGFKAASSSASKELKEKPEIDHAGAAGATMGATSAATKIEATPAESGVAEAPEKAPEKQVPVKKVKPLLLAGIEKKTSTALQIMIENPKNIMECYVIEQKELGKGAFGSVKRAKVRATGAVRAVKFVLKSRMKGKDFFLKNEIEILKCVDHPNVIKLYELFEDSEQLFMVMELCSGGALLDHLHRAGRFNEPQAAKSMVQIFRAVYYLHLQMICHRDIKPANCLLATRDAVERSSMRVTDFGLSCKFVQGKNLTERVGTTAFMAPQVIGRKYDHRCDIWSCGVVMYMLLCGRTPFSAKTEDEVRAKVSIGSFQFDPNVWLDVSEDAMQLIRRLLKVNVSQRHSLPDALRCDWLRKKVAEANIGGWEMDVGLLQNLRGFRSLNKFKRAALCIIASFLGEEQTRDARELFCALDTDEDGMLDHLELKGRLESIYDSQSECRSYSDNSQAAAEAMDLRMKLLRSASEEEFCGMEPEPYTYTEFLAATFDRRLYCQRGVCWAAFNALDVNGDGCLTVQELATGGVLGDLPEDELTRLITDFDCDGDGTIDFQEFMEMMRDGEGWSPQVRSPRSISSGTSMSSPRRSGRPLRQLKRGASGTSITSGSSLTSEKSSIPANQIVSPRVESKEPRRSADADAKSPSSPSSAPWTVKRTIRRAATSEALTPIPIDPPAKGSVKPANGTGAAGTSVSPPRSPKGSLKLANGTGAAGAATSPRGSIKSAAGTGTAGAASSPRSPRGSVRPANGAGTTGAGTNGTGAIGATVSPRAPKGAGANNRLSGSGGAVVVSKKAQGLADATTSASGDGTPRKNVLNVGGVKEEKPAPVGKAPRRSGFAALKSVVRGT